MNYFRAKFTQQGRLQNHGCVFFILPFEVQADYIFTIFRHSKLFLLSLTATK